MPFGITRTGPLPKPRLLLDEPGRHLAHGDVGVQVA